MSGFKEAIRSGIEEYLQGLQRVIEGLTPAEARWQATDADLARECRHPRQGVVTRTWIVGHLLVEESQHTGQAAMIRGMMRGFEA